MKKGKGSAKQILLLLVILIILIIVFLYLKNSDIIAPMPEPASDNRGCTSTTFGFCPDGKTVRNYDGSSCIQPLHGWNDEESTTTIEGFSQSNFKQLKKCVNNCILSASDYQGGGNQNGEYNGGGGSGGGGGGGGGGSGGGNYYNGGDDNGNDGNYDWLNRGNVPVWNPNPDQRQTWKPYGKNKPGYCMGTQYGCCWDGTAKNKDGSNCPAPKGNCRQAPYGCCIDGQTSKNNPNGLNCPPFKPNPNSPVPCARKPYGCCPDGREARRGKKDDKGKILPETIGGNCYGIFI